MQLLNGFFGSLGSRITMEYPCVILMGKGAKAEILSVTTATKHNQVQDSGGKAIHLAPNTHSRIISKSISSNGGISTYRGMVKIIPGATNCKSLVQCDALILDDISQADAYPCFDIRESDVSIAHEAKVSKIEDEKTFYLMSRGLTQMQAESLIVNGFVEPFIKELPPDYAIEMERLIEMEIEDAGEEPTNSKQTVVAAARMGNTRVGPTSVGSASV